MEYGFNLGFQLEIYNNNHVQPTKSGLNQAKHAKKAVLCLKYGTSKVEWFIIIFPI